jgi:hypothetical protein
MPSSGRVRRVRFAWRLQAWASQCRAQVLFLTAMASTFCVARLEDKPKHLTRADIAVWSEQTTNSGSFLFIEVRTAARSVQPRLPRGLSF